ncbi:hypothetical protein [Nannocystis punicea]|uniref:Lipoprotein n=1 Tax=Nannocystis punicea TaxID=2995304 RepID=A0ABY7HEN8_9BACT|nr:hypothetical protein [Nannocystis poenicansa]WAS97489.1 hypothetical protein O0S08_15195 [Nannocystis poenicansa]
MRRSLTALFFTSALLAVSGCSQPKKDLLALPAAYDPQGADLTFNKKNLESFNSMKPQERDDFVKSLQEKPGSFRGQAVTEAGNGLAAGVEGSEHGAWETFAHVTEPVLFEITIDYRIFSTEELGRPLGRNLPISFTGTLVDLRYDAESKPRKLTIQVKADSMALITDKTTPAS